MDIHKNARLTLRSREQLVHFVLSGQRISAAARRFLVTHKTATKWVQRFRAQGAAGLTDRSSRPLHSPRATSSSLAVRVVELRREHRPAYHIALSTRTQPIHSEPHSAARSPQPMARSAPGTPRAAIRTPLPRRSAAPRYQGPYPLSGGFAARRRPPPRPASAPRLRGPARRHRRPLPPRLYSDAARPEGRNHHRLSPRRPRLLRPPRNPRAGSAHRQRKLLPLPPVPRHLQRPRYQTPPNPALHTANQRQSRTLYP